MSPSMPVSPQKCSPDRAPRRNAAELSGRGGEAGEACHTCPQSPGQGPGDWLRARGKPGEKPGKVLAVYFTFTLSKLVPGRRHPGPGVQKPGWSPSYRPWPE